MEIEFDNVTEYTKFKAALGNYIYRNDLGISILAEVLSPVAQDTVVAKFSIDKRPPEQKRGYKIVAISQDDN